ncbi:MAG: alpha-mannosyltransferase [Azospirillum brasilense]|nr:MAG: alpha-mannosyltransferase [Azospirillum brasilense]
MPWTPGAPSQLPPAPARILIVSDAWEPQVNGVVRTLRTVVDLLQRDGDVVEVLGPDRFSSLPMPSYPEIRLACSSRAAVEAQAEAFRPQTIHIATEGPLGWMMRAACRRRGWPFTTSFHTRFPDYLHLRARVPPSWSWAVLRRFHAASAGTLAATPSLLREMEGRGFPNLRLWTRGVDLERFRPGLRGGPLDHYAGLRRPVFACFGRVAVEKNIEAFLDLDLPGSKVVVGDGPRRAALQARFPDAHFLGQKHGEALAACYADADVLVFPSRTDTFGLVMLEALASGTPVAAFPVPGPLDVLGGATKPVGAMNEDLRIACLDALALDRAVCRSHAEGWSWARCKSLLRTALVPIPQPG